MLITLPMKMRREAISIMGNAKITINSKAIERLKRKIILQEGHNLKTREKSDQQMVSWIKKQIEEEAQCYLNQ